MRSTLLEQHVVDANHIISQNKHINQERTKYHDSLGNKLNKHTLQDRTSSIFPSFKRPQTGKLKPRPCPSSPHTLPLAITKYQNTKNKIITIRKPQFSQVSLPNQFLTGLAALFFAGPAAPAFAGLAALPFAGLAALAFAGLAALAFAGLAALFAGLTDLALAGLTDRAFLPGDLAGDFSIDILTPEGADAAFAVGFLVAGAGGALLVLMDAAGLSCDGRYVLVW